MDTVKNAVNLELIIPKLKIKGKYEMNGQILILRLDGKGDFWLDAGKYIIFSNIKQYDIWYIFRED